MARIDIDDDFWEVVQVVAATGRDLDKTISQALRLIQFSQQRYKSGKIITRSEFDARGFFPEFIGVHVVEIEAGCLQYIHAEEKFRWLLDRKEAGRRGGVRSGEVRKTTGETESTQTSDSNGLRRSKPEANLSKPNPLTLTLSSGSKEPEIQIGCEAEQLEIIPDDPLDWMIRLWNECRKNSFTDLRKISNGSTRFKHVSARLLEYPDQAIWRRAFQLMESSEFLSGRNGVWAGGGFDWLVESPKNMAKVLAGNYNPETKSKPKVDWTAEATIILDAVIHHRKRETFSPDRLALMRKAGLTWSQMGMWPPNDFTIKKIATLLKEAAP